MEKIKYYLVEAKCGHVRRSQCTYKKLPIKAKTAKEAADIARNTPRVKHDHKDAIIDVKEISYEEFLELKKEHDSDPYFQATCSADQKRIDMYDEIVPDPHYVKKYKTTYDDTDRQYRIYFRQKKYKYKIKNMEDFQYEEYEDEDCYD